MLNSKWSRELIRFLSAKSQFILWGNIHDVYPIELQGNITTLRINAFINSTLRAQGYLLIVKSDTFHHKKYSDWRNDPFLNAASLRSSIRSWLSPELKGELLDRAVNALTESCY